jgi:hypothetical protein
MRLSGLLTTHQGHSARAHLHISLTMILTFAAKEPSIMQREPTNIPKISGKQIENALRRAGKPSAKSVSECPTEPRPTLAELCFSRAIVWISNIYCEKLMILFDASLIRISG